jgi:hypothetical protein
MNNIEVKIKKYFDQEIDIVKSRIKEDVKLEQIYYYLGFEILPYCDSFYKVNGKICNFSNVNFQNFEIEIYGEQLTKLGTESKNSLSDYIYTLTNPPTHIKATHDVATDTTTFEYIYDKLLDEDKGDTFGTYYREWQYQLGKPRPIKNKIPKGHHIEFRMEPQYTFDDQGRVTKIESALIGVLVKDEDKNK